MHGYNQNVISLQNIEGGRQGSQSAMGQGQIGHFGNSAAQQQNMQNNQQMVGLMNANRGSSGGDQPPYGEQQKGGADNDMNMGNRIPMDNLGQQNNLLVNASPQQHINKQLTDPYKIQDYKKKCSEMVHSSPILKLTVVSSPTLQRGQVLTINAQGLFGAVESEREKECPGSGLDGYTFFGSTANWIEHNPNDGQPMMEDQNNKKRIVINDFVIPFRNQTQSEQHYGRHFTIWFDIQTKRYMIRDLQVGYGVFQKMDQGSAVLRPQMLVNVGDVHIFVQMLPVDAEDKGQNYEVLKLKYFGATGSSEEFEYQVKQMQNGNR